MKKILSILVAAAMVTSVCSLFFTTAATENEFTPQHAYVDFENYSIVNNNHTNRANYSQNLWSIKADETEGKSLSFIYNAANETGTATQFGGGKMHQSAFLVNSVGSTKDDSSYYITLEPNAYYRVKLKYKVNSADANLAFAFDSFPWYYNSSTQFTNSSGTKVNNYLTQTIKEVNDSGTVSNPNKATSPSITGTDGDWHDWEAVFVANNTSAETNWKNYLRFRISVPSTAKDIDFQIDDLQVDKLAAVNVISGESSETVNVAPPCSYSQYLFSSVGDFAGDDIINYSVETYTTGAATGTATLKGLYKDAACTEPINSTSEVFSQTPVDGAYNCYKKIITSENQVAFVGFDTAPSKRLDTKPDGLPTVNTVYNKAHSGLFKEETTDAYTGTKCVKYNYSGYAKEIEDTAKANNTAPFVYNYLYIGNGVGLEYGKSYLIAFYVKKDTNYQTDVNTIDVFATGSASLATNKDYNNAAKVHKQVTLTEDWQRVELYYTPEKTVLSKTNEFDSALSPVLSFGEYTYSIQKCDFLIDSISISEIMTGSESNGTVTAAYKSGTLSGTEFSVKEIGTLIKPASVEDELVYSNASKNIYRSNSAAVKSEFTAVVKKNSDDERAVKAVNYIVLENGEVVYTPVYEITDVTDSNADFTMDFSLYYTLGNVNGDYNSDGTACIDIRDLVATAVLDSGETRDNAITANKIALQELRNILLEK